jgi:hypothetical protein
VPKVPSARCDWSCLVSEFGRVARTLDDLNAAGTGAVCDLGLWVTAVRREMIGADTRERRNEAQLMRPVRNPGTESPTVEVIVFRDGREIAHELCDTREDAVLAVERWSEEQGVVCQVDDLSVHHRPEDIREPSPDDLVVDDYPVDGPADEA